MANKINKVTIEIVACNHCPHFQEEDTDVYHGCNYTPDFCLKKKKVIDDSTSIPDWCPLLK